MNKKKFSAGCVVLILLACCSGLPQQAPNPEIQNEEIVETALLYMAQPGFSSTDFAQQLTGLPVEHELLDLGEKYVYFSLDQALYQGEQTLRQLTVKPDKVEFARGEPGRLMLGDLVYRGENRIFFRFPMFDFKVDPDGMLKARYQSATYTISLAELTDFRTNRSIYGGKLRALTENSYDGFYNQGAFIARNAEPSLGRLTKQLVQNLQKKEHVAQILLDFVTTELKYDGRVQLIGKQILKRPNEVLLTRKGDCGSLTVLYSSLLEQADIDYLLLYIIPESQSEFGHLTVAVAGDFENQNGLGFSYDGKDYSVAEITADDFEIGISRLAEGYKIEDFDYVQNPRRPSEILSTRTGRPLKFN